MSKQLHGAMGKITFLEKSTFQQPDINYSPILSLPLYIKDTETHRGLVITAVSIFQVWSSL